MLETSNHPTTSRIISHRRRAVKVARRRRLPIEVRQDLCRRADEVNDKLLDYANTLRKLKKADLELLREQVFAAPDHERKCLALRWPPSSPIAVMVMETLIEAEHTRRKAKLS